MFGEFQTPEDLLDDQDVLSTLSLACEIATRQCEESFCDAIGVRLFGEAFLHAFEYLLVPSLGGDRLELYPPLSRRLSDMREAAQAFGYELRYEHSPPLLETERSLEKRERFAVQTADDAARKLAPLVLEKARTYCEEKRVPMVDVTKCDEIAEDFAAIVPGHNSGYLGNIVNAGWLIYKEFETFAPEIEDRDRAYDILNNLVFKSLEVLEYERKV